MPVDNLLINFADFLTGDAVVHGHSVLGHGLDGHESLSDTGADFLALPVRGPSSGSKIAASFFELNLPKHYAKRLATKAVNKAAWFHDAVVDFQETDFFWEARRFARRHVVAEAFGLGALAGGVLLLTAPAPKRPPPQAPKETTQDALAQLSARRAGPPSRRTLGAPPLPPVPRAPAAVRIMEGEDPSSGPDGNEAEDELET